MTENNKIVLFLGSGATKGSGIKKNGQKLPTDQEFFKEGGVPAIIDDWEKGYPALNLCRKEFPAIKENSLYQTWNQLFIFRGLARAGFCEDESLNEKFDELENREWLDNFTQQKNHYSWQFKAMRQCWPRLYYLAELAIWDLRVLVKQLYSELNCPENSFNTLKNKLDTDLDQSIVVNLNYDTTFDDCIGNGFSPLQEKDKLVENLTKKIIRPHGSLQWTSKNLFSLKKKDWIHDWDETFEDTNLRHQGYQKNSISEILIFCQSLIVPPAYFKEEIIGNSTMPGLASQLLWNQWRHMEMALRQADEIIFYGTSLASGDGHLCFLIRTNSNNKKIRVIDKKKTCLCKKRFERKWKERFPEVPKENFKFDYIKSKKDT